MSKVRSPVPLTFAFRLTSLARQEHLSVALALSLPIVCVITKVDSTPAPVYEQTVKQLVKILKSPGCRKKPVFVRAPECAKVLPRLTALHVQVNDVGMACELASGFAAEKACPIFRCSNVTGEGLDLLKVRQWPVSPRRLSQERG